MKSMEEAARALEQSGKADKLKALANSVDGRKLEGMLDVAEVERAAQSGDQAALRQILTRVLSTDEGKRLAEQLKKVMKD